PDDGLAFHDRLPAEQMAHAFEQRADAAAAAIGHRPVIVQRKGKLLVLGADAEFLARLYAVGDPGDEFVPRLDRCQVKLVAGHSRWLSEGSAGLAGRETIRKPGGRG